MKIIKDNFIIVILFIAIFLISFLSYLDNSKTIINIGVPFPDYTFHRYDLLKKDIESNFDVKVNFVSLYEGVDFESNYTERDIMLNINNILEANKVDMVIGLDSHHLQFAVNDNRMLDITDYIENIDYIHKGVIDRSKKIGNGRIFNISPILYDLRVVFQNELIFQDLNIDLLPQYATWYELLDKLDEIQEEIDIKDELNYWPLALAVANNEDDELLYIGHFFLPYGWSLDSPMFNEGKFTPRWENYFKIWSQIISKYGKTLYDMDNGRVPGNNIFNNGQYALMIGVTHSYETIF